jgi:hypothetical protein
MADRARYYPHDALPDDGTNGHFPMQYTEEGLGPADAPEANFTACWCGQLDCMLFYGDDRFPNG